MMRFVVSILTGLSMLVGLVFRLDSAVVTWDGSTSESWETDSNWDSSNKPTATDSVRIPSGFTVNLSLATLSEALHVRIDAGSVLNVVGTSQLLVQNSPGHGIENAGTISSFGTITIRNTGLNGLRTFANSSTQVEFLSSLIVEDANNVGIRNDGDFINLGTVTIDSSGTIGLINAKTFSNQGLLNIWNSEDIGLLNQDSLYNGLLQIIDIFNKPTISSGLHNQYGFIENLGQITINSQMSGTGVFNEGYFSTNILTILNTNLALQNSSVVGSFLSIGPTTITTCNDGILNRSLFTVQPLSVVTIQGSVDVPLECLMYATFDNMGILNIIP